MNLQKLLKPFVAADALEKIDSNATVSGLSIDSRNIKQDELFIACPGYSFDARQFMQPILETGNNWVLAEEQGIEDFDSSSKRLILLDDLYNKISEIAARFFQNPTQKQNTVGITGTNGKTSCCYLLSQALDFLQHKTLMLSTLGNGDCSKLEASANTTPDALSIQKLASEYLAKQYHYLAMEVSSHGLSLKRVAAVNYDVAVFTNLSHDHLDFHGDMESYFAAKRELFTNPALKYAVINANDAYGQKLLQDQEISARKLAFSLQTKEQLLAQGFDLSQTIYCDKAEYSLDGLTCDLYTPWGQAKLRSSLLGEFNLANLLAVAASLGAMFGAIEKWIIALNSAQAVPGRMHSFNSVKNANIVVDYAHTPDALEKALQAARKHCQGKLWCVFGCGGDRDNAKRAVMGQVAEQFSDMPIITDDNPRTETAESIAKMIQSGMSAVNTPYLSDRKAAIKFALENATAEDLILVAGKGHEDYQEIGTTKKHYSDLETAAELLQVAS